MAIFRFEYKAPGSLEAALSVLNEKKGRCRILAGGTDLIVQIRSGQAHPDVVVDVKKIPELNRLEWIESKGLHIGAAVPLSKLIAFPTLVEKFNMLAQACFVIGSTQIRNRATIGGNVCNAAPSADSLPSLLCLEAKAIVASASMMRTIPLDEFFLAPGKTTLRENELLLAIEAPTPARLAAGCYLKHTTREGMDIAVAGVASLLILTPKGNKVQEARIAVGAVAPTPLRARQAEAVLNGKIPTPALLGRAAELAAEITSPISDVRSSAQYRGEMVKALTRRTLRQCCETLGL